MHLRSASINRSIDDLRNDLNLDRLKLQDWLHANKLSMNVVKTQSLIIGSGPNIGKIESQPDAPPSFAIGDQDIEMITSIRYLGIQMIVNSTGASAWILSRPRLIEPLDLLSILRNIFHLMYSTKCIEELLSPV